MSGRNDEVLLNGLYYEWLNNMTAYNVQLDRLLFQIKGLYHEKMGLALRRDLNELQNKLFLLKEELEELSDEVSNKRGKLLRKNRANANVIQFSEVIENNHLRDKIRKAEQAVFYVKYQVNKLLTLAS